MDLSAMSLRVVKRMYGPAEWTGHSVECSGYLIGQMDQPTKWAGRSAKQACSAVIRPHAGGPETKQGARKLGSGSHCNF